MPLLLLSSGAVLCVHPECFALADDPDSDDEDDYASIVSRSQQEDGFKVGKTASKFRSRFPPSRSKASKHAVEARGAGIRKSADFSDNSSVNSAQTAQTAGTFHTVNSAIDSYLHRRSDLFVPRNTSPEGDDAQYHVKLVFQATTSYLAVPYVNFARILDDNKLVLPKIAKEIKWYLQSPSDQLKERISRLLPWVQGNIDFNQREKSSKVLTTLNFLPAEIGPRTDEL
jgi:hypothetical protein